MTNIEYFYDVTTYGSLFLPRPVFMFSFANQSRPPRFKKNIKTWINLTYLTSHLNFPKQY